MEEVDQGGSLLGLTHFQVGELWVYATSLHDGWGDHQYFVYNPQTGALLQFTPEASRAGATYQSRQTQIRGTAAGTGVVGGYLEKGFGALALGGFGGAVLLEAGGYYLLTEEVAPAVGRVAVQAYRVAAPAVRTYAQRAAKGALVRMAVDAGFQYGTGYLAADPSQGSRAVQARRGVNGTSVIAAGLVSVGEAKTYAKSLVALGTSMTTNYFTVSGANNRKYHSYFHVVDFANQGQSIEYVRNVILGTIFDQTKEHGSEKVAKYVAEWADKAAAQASGRVSQNLLRWLTEQRIALPASFLIGGIPETIKKHWENEQDAAEEAQKAAEASARAKTSTKYSPAP